MMIESFTCLQCDETMIDNHMTSFLLAGSEPVVLVVLACECLMSDCIVQVRHNKSQAERVRMQVVMTFDRSGPVC